MIIIVDYDRTLVNSQKQITKSTKESLLKRQEDGDTLIIASGRPIAGLMRISKELKMDVHNGFLIGCNGSYIYDCKKEKMVFTNVLMSKELNRITEVIEKMQLPYALMNHEQLYINFEHEDLADEALSNNIPSIKYNDENFEVAKIVLADTPSTIHTYYKELNANIGSEFNIVKSSPRYLEINHYSVDKGDAIIKLMKHIKNNSITVGFGDSNNDITMLKACDVAVAMGNATEETALVAKYITLSNENDGIAYFFNHIFEW